jgi:pyruvate-ferredoxin/flavodoxin oxidoreductase
MEKFAALTGRRYGLFNYHGHPEAARVIVIMGSGTETVRETVDRMIGQGERVGVVTVRLYRPFSVPDFVAALPSTTCEIAVLDRTKKPGAVGDPLYLDVVAAVREASNGKPHLAKDPVIVGGRYGLSSKEFTPGMVKTVFDELTALKPRNHFTLGIVDDVTHTSLPFESLNTDDNETFQAVFYGLGSDGTVEANKNSIKIVGDATDLHTQGYFVYDSKKAGAVTISHLRFGPRPIHSPYLVRNANFVACHQWEFLERFDLLDSASPSATLLLNSPHPPEKVWDNLPLEAQEAILEKGLKVYAIDAYKVARKAGLAGRINTIMQTCFFYLSDILDETLAIAKIKEAIQKTYGKRGPIVVRNNGEAVDQALAHLHKLDIPEAITSRRRRPPIVSEEAPDFVQRVTAALMANPVIRCRVSTLTLSEGPSPHLDHGS